jgi:dipeptidyl aminopeptidase/acylaminoacyl peptidase
MSDTDERAVAGSRTLCLDDIFALDRIGEAQISPDGSRVAFVVTREYTEGDHHIPEASIWLVPDDGSAPARRFTFGAHADTHPRWSPDGRTLAFLSDRAKDDVLQVYIIPMDGGEAQRLTDARGGVSDLLWSPDGSQIAYLAPDAESNEEERRHKEKDDAIHVDHDDKFTRLWVVAAQGGEPRVLTPAEYQVRGFAWYADGLAVATSPTPKEDDFVVPWALRYVREGQPEETLWRGRATLERLAGSPDGRALAWHQYDAAGGEPADELWVLERDGEPRRALTEFSGGLSSLLFLPDGASLLIAAVESTRHVLGRLALASEEVETLLGERTFASEGLTGGPVISVSRDGRRFACTLEDGTHPTEIWTGTLGEEPRQVTSFNPFLREMALGASETVRWQAPDGRSIEGVLIYPSGYEVGKRYPLVVHAHGGPLWQWLDRLMLNWHDWGQWLAAHGYAVLLPNPRGSYGRGLEYAWCNRRAWGLGDFQDVLSGVDALVERGIVDPDRLGIGGWSYGGFMTAWAIGHTDRFKAAVVGAGVTDLLSFQAADIPSWLPTEQMQAQPWDDPEIYARCSPITYVGNVATPTLVLHGASDERVRLGQGRELYNALRARKVPTEMVIYPREPHLFGERHHQHDLLARVLEWYDRWLKPSE